jgi:hypothetical protein
MENLLVLFKQDLVPRDEIESALTSYNSCCAEMRSEARDDNQFGVNGIWYNALKTEKV